MDTKYILGPDAITREIQMSGTVNQDTREPVLFLQQLGTRVPLDTGFMPPGLRSYSQAGDHSQMVIELPPGVNMINWSETENDAKKGDYNTYRLAQPYRVIVASFLNGNLLGARMFYSPYPIASPDQVLYHQNVPNINCMGYENTSVGWVCLYHKHDWSTMTIAQRAMAIIERCSGSEVYNNVNMPDTDGPHFYARMGAPNFVTDPNAWEAKSIAEGHEWTLDPNLWIECRVLDTERQLRHDDSGTKLTLRMVMDAMAPMYYNDNYHPKPDVALRREDLVADPNQLFTKVVQEAFVRSTAIDYQPNKSIPNYEESVIAASLPLLEGVESMNQGLCSQCNSYVLDYSNIDGFGVICDNCMEQFYICDNCGYHYHGDDIVCHSDEFGHESYFCAGCFKVMSKKEAAKQEEDVVKKKVKKKLQAAVSTQDSTQTVSAPSSFITALENAFSASAGWKDWSLPNTALNTVVFLCSSCGVSKPIAEKHTVNLPPEAMSIKPGIDHYSVCDTCVENVFFCYQCYSLHAIALAKATFNDFLAGPNCWSDCSMCNRPFLNKDIDSNGQCVNCSPF